MYVRTNPSSWVPWVSCAIAAVAGLLIVYTLLLAIVPSGAGPLFLHPLLIVLRGVHVEPAPHPRVAEAAQLRAGDLVLPRLGRLKPLVNLPPGDSILLEAEVGHIEAVDDIPGFEDEDHGLSDRHVDFVVERLVVIGPELAVRPRVGDLPVELL